MKNNAKKLEELLIEKWNGSITILARSLGQTEMSICQVIKRWIRKKSTQKRYTKAFNQAFGENFTSEEIFDNL